MNENLRTAAIEGEAPVNPYSLLEAINASSRTAHTGWLIFIGVMTYLLIAVAGVTHKDLLLSRDVTLPLLQVDIGLTRFFLFAPILLVLFHLGVVVQLALLARKTLEFDTAMRMLEATDRRTHPLRLELHNFFFVQTLAGPQRSRIMSVFLHTMSWLTLVILPVLLLLTVQVAFLPYHDANISWVHRVILMADMVMLILLGVFLLRPETSFPRAIGTTMRRHPVGLLITSAVLGLVTAFSFLVATVPGEPLDRAAQALTSRGLDEGSRRSEREAGFVIPFFGRSADGSLFGLFERNLNVTDLDLVDKDVTSGERSLVLRGRDLRFARLDRTDLHQADLTGADLEGASLVGADLRGALLLCADGIALAATQDRRIAGCVNARRANLARAKLKDARMAGIDLTGARLDEADLEAADLKQAVLAGGSLHNALLQRAELTGVSAQGAKFTGALLQGADFTAALLAGADFTGSGLQGATLAQANLVGATLRDTDLEAADLGRARLHGVNLRGAKIRAADLRGASIWKTAAPDREAAQLVDLGQLTLVPLADSEVVKLNQALSGIGPQGREALAPLLTTDSTRPWMSAADQQTWQALGTASAAGTADNYKARLTDDLVRLICRLRWGNGSVATGVAKRALAPDFKGDMPAIYDRLKADDCPAGKAVSRDLMRSLAMAADAARGN
jgi:uncharacterized protein YjbI with pentapeptide repeats